MSNTAKFTKRMELGTPTDNAPICVDGFCNADGQRFEVCAVWGVDDDSCECEQSIANAHLIAAAPEMYEALEDAADLLFQSQEKECREHGKEIRALLAKARGEA